MSLVDYLALGAILLLVGGAVLYLVLAKKRGQKCIGCPYAKQCAKKTQGCPCHTKEEKK